jgi:hypothetical protein
MRVDLTKDQAEGIYKILEECCGAANDELRAFVDYMCLKDRDLHGSEWRFCGWLGFGGKLYSNSQGVYVDCYAEEKSPLAVFAIKIANERITDLLGLR